MTSSNIVGSGGFSYEMNPEWAKLPEGWEMPTAAVYGDSQDRVYAFNRDPEHPVCIFDKEGNFVSAWGAGLINFAHSILLDNNDNVWLVDRNTHEVHKYTGDGQHIMTIGQKGVRSDTGVDPEDYSSTAFQSVTHGGPPFNMPAGIALNDEGQIFIADGYANARVHKFTPEGQLIQSWGEPGDGPRTVPLAPRHLDRQERAGAGGRPRERPRTGVHPGRRIHQHMAQQAHRPGAVLRRLRRHRVHS